MKLVHLACRHRATHDERSDTTARNDRGELTHEVFTYAVCDRCGHRWRRYGYVDLLHDDGSFRKKYATFVGSTARFHW